MRLPKASEFLAVAALLGSATLLARCGGSGNGSPQTITTSGANVQSISVNAGPAGNYGNGVFTSVTVCVASTSNCQTISGILVDTGSYGLRLLSAAGGGALTLSLGLQTGPVGECAPFVDGYTWGPVATADIQIGGESAPGIPVQIIDPTFAAVPAECTAFGLPENDNLTTLGVNGILGVGPFLEDCGSACMESGSANPGLYYDCSTSPCQVTTQALAQQVVNPVGSFATDNNGVIVELPAASSPVASLAGSLVFGIGTESNNAIGGAVVFPVNASAEFSTTYSGQTYPAFIDSGSNGFFFLDSSTTSLSLCGDDVNFYCPNSPAKLSATVVSGSVSEPVPFTVNNADNLFSDQTAFVLPGLAGPNPGTFDWGLPFFFGRNVFTAIAARSTSAGTGPYWAF
jgi:Protein of unknown function (DUF3443)